MSDQVAYMLVILGVLGLIVETLVPGGIIGFLGATSLVAGLYRLEVISATWAIVVLIAFGVLLAAFAVPALKVRKQRSSIGPEAMVGMKGIAKSDLAPEGKVAAMGTLWRARSAVPVTTGAEVRITATDGLLLLVEPADEQEA